MHDNTAPFQTLLTSFAPGTSLLRAWPLTGGVSSDVTGLEVCDQAGQIRKLVVRQHSAAEFETNPDIALDEYRLLQTLYLTDIPVPRPLHLDQTCEIFEAPVLVLEFIEGETDARPQDAIETVWQMAEHLHQIHLINPAQYDLKFLPDAGEKNVDRILAEPERPDTSLQEDRVRALLKNACPLPASNPPTLLHGDFWPGNVLWKDGVITAVIDWENMASGDPVDDVANARMEMLWAFGYDAMEAFTAHYQTLSNQDFSMLPWYDLCAALRPAGKLHTWAIEPAREQSMRNGHKMFVEQAIRAID